MSHPSMDNPDEDRPELPDGVTEERLEQLVDETTEAAQRLGLHSTGLMEFQQHGDHLLLGMHFQVGQLAFAKPVQDPEQAKFDDEFRTFAAGATAEERDEILSRYLKKPDAE